MFKNIFGQDAVPITEEKVKLVLKVIEDNVELYNPQNFEELYKKVEEQAHKSHKLLINILAYVLETATGFSTSELLKYIGDTIFSNFCYDRIDLKEVIIPNNITTVSGYAFSRCDTLEKLYIPKSVTYLEYDAIPLDAENYLKIQYEGTVDDFNNIRGIEQLNNLRKDYVIECSDGTLTLGK